MEIKSIKRPWEKQSNYGTRLSKDPFYQSQSWKNTKASFKRGHTLTPNGFPLSNIYCYDCYVEGNKFNSISIEIDHNTAIKDGGSRTDHNNLRSRCKSHHSRKSAIEGNERRKRK